VDLGLHEGPRHQELVGAWAVLDPVLYFGINYQRQNSSSEKGPASSERSLDLLVARTSGFLATAVVPTSVCRENRRVFLGPAVAPLSVLSRGRTRGPYINAIGTVE